MLKDQLLKISRLQFDDWLFGPEKFAGLSRNRPLVWVLPQQRRALKGGRPHALFAWSVTDGDVIWLESEQHSCSLEVTKARFFICIDSSGLCSDSATKRRPKR